MPLARLPAGQLPNQPTARLRTLPITVRQLDIFKVYKVETIGGGCGL